MMEPSSNSTLVPCEARWVAGIKGKKKRLLDPEGYVMQYIKTDGARKFFKCSEHAEGCGVRVSVLWETNVSAATMASTTATTTCCWSAR